MWCMVILCFSGWLSAQVIKITNKTIAVLKQSTWNRFDWLFYSCEFLFLDKQPENTVVRI